MDERKPVYRPPQLTNPEPLRVDPGDARLYARRMQEAKRVGPLGKLLRYGAGALALAGAFAVYWNFETLRTLRWDLSGLKSLLEDVAGREGQGPSRSGGEPATEVVEGAGVAGVSLATSIDGEAPKAETGAVEAPAPVAPEPAPGAPAAPPAAAAAEPAANEALATDGAVAPPPAEELPVTPETFGFGLSVINFSEADASAAVLVLRDGGRRGVSSVTWWTTDGTAKAGSDYVSFDPRVERFAVGEQNRTIRIPIIGDRNAEGPENFYVHVAAGETASASGESAAQLEVVINDDD